MTEVDQSEQQFILIQSLRLVKDRLRMVMFGSALMLMLAAAALMLTVAVAADHLTPGGLPADVRNVIRWSIAGCELALLAGLLAWPLVRRISDLYAARLIETAHPQLGNDVTSAIQLVGDPRVEPGALAAIRRRAARELAAVDAASAVPVRSLRVSAILLGLVAVVTGLLVVMTPKPVLPSLARAFGRDVPPPTYTRIVEFQPPSNTIVVAGQTVAFSADVVNPGQEVTLRISRDNGRTWLAEDAFQMKRGAELAGDAERFEASWIASADPAAGSVAVFEITSGDAWPVIGRLAVLPTPAVGLVRTEIAWPQYTGRGKEGHDGGHVEAIGPLPSGSARGAVATITAETNLPIAQASMVFENSPPVVMDVSGRQMSAAFEVTGDDRYRIVCRGHHESIRCESISYDVRATTDQPPVVRLASPVGRVELPTDQSLRLAGEAGDDFGIVNVALVCDDSGLSRRIELAEFAPSGVRSRPIETALPAEELGRVGQTLTCYLEATDCRPPSGQTARSEPFTLTLVAPAATPPSERPGPGESDDEDHQDQSDPQEEQHPEDAGDATPSQDADPRQMPGEAGEPGQAQPPSDEHSPAEGKPGQPNAGQQPPGESNDSGASEPTDPAEALLQQAQQDAAVLEALARQMQPAREASALPAQAQQPNQPSADSSEESDTAEANPLPQVDTQITGPEDPLDPQKQKANEPSQVTMQPTGAEKLPDIIEQEDMPGRASDQEFLPADLGELPLVKPPSFERQEPKKRTKLPPMQLVRGDVKKRGDREETQRKLDPSDNSPPPSSTPVTTMPVREEESKSSEGLSGPAGGLPLGKKKGPIAPMKVSGWSRGKQRGYGGEFDPPIPVSGNLGGESRWDKPGAEGDPSKPSGKSGQRSGKQGTAGLESGQQGGQPGERPDVQPGEGGELDLSDLDLLTPGQRQARLESIGRIIDEADRRLRAGEVDEELLAELDMTPAALAGFVERYKLSLEELRTFAGGRSPQASEALGSDEVQAGRDATLSGASGTESLQADETELRGRGERQVSPEYRRAVEDYFRAVSEQPATK